MSDIFDQVKKITIRRIDQMLTDNVELQDMMLRNTEFIRLKNLEYFEKKRELEAEKFALEQVEAKVMLKLDPSHIRNAEMRKAAVTIDSSTFRQRNVVINLQLEVEEMEQELWTLRHLESNLRLVAELRIIELKKL